MMPYAEFVESRMVAIMVYYASADADPMSSAAVFQFAFACPLLAYYARVLGSRLMAVSIQPTMALAKLTVS